MNKILFKSLMKMLKLNNKYNKEYMAYFYRIIGVRWQYILIKKVIEKCNKENKNVDINFIKSINKKSKEEYEKSQKVLKNLTDIDFGYFNKDKEEYYE